MFCFVYSFTRATSNTLSILPFLWPLVWPLMIASSMISSVVSAIVVAPGVDLPLVVAPGVVELDSSDEGCWLPADEPLLSWPLLLNAPSSRFSFSVTERS
uniref:(northern house mosquito) hypothetical protein n=1 Tax=Culex pipiens TaxID=7175 RepID=A0A8D8L678_CULPI